MWNTKSRLVAIDATVEEQIQIENAGAPTLDLCRARAARLDFNGQQRLEQSARRESGFEFDDRVEVSTLPAGSDRIRFVDVRCPRGASTVDGGERPRGEPKVRLAITEIGSESDISRLTHDAAMVARVHRRRT